MTVSTAGVSAYQSQFLLSMLSRLANIQSTPTQPSSTNFNVSSATPDVQQSNPAVGPSTPPLSNNILRVLIEMQAQNGASTAGQINTAATQTGSASTDPIQSFFNAMDSNGDGSISQSEMESYITSLGGTQQEADALYSSLQPSAGGVSENQLAAAATSGSGQPHHHHHHHHGGASLANKAANDFVQAVDSNGDGTISQSEFQNFIAQIGGTTDEATNDFAGLTANGSTALTASSLASALKTLNPSQVNLSAQSSPILAVLDAIGTSNGKSTATNSA